MDKPKVYPKNSLIVQRVINGYKVTAKGTQEMQEDEQNGEYVFNSLAALVEWVKNYYKENKTGY